MSWCFPEETSTESRDLFQVVRSAEIAVPAVWPLETANAVAMAVRKQRLTAEAATEFLHRLQDLRIQVWAAEQNASLLFEAARRHELTTYDASYVELAAHLQVPLATFDKAMRRAAERVGVPLLV